MSDLYDALETATAAFAAAVDATEFDQIENETPCDEWNVGELIEHTTGTLAFFGSCLGVEDLAPLVAPGDGEGFALHGKTVAAAWRDRGLDGTIALGDSELPAPLALGINAMDIYLHVHDLRTALGHDSALDEATCALLLEATGPAIDQNRAGGGFAAAVETDSTSAADRLVAFSGRG